MEINVQSLAAICPPGRPRRPHLTPATVPWPQGRHMEPAGVPQRHSRQNLRHRIFRRHEEPRSVCTTVVGPYWAGLDPMRAYEMGPLSALALLLVRVLVASQCLRVGEFPVAMLALEPFAFRVVNVVVLDFSKSRVFLAVVCDRKTEELNHRFCALNSN
ncbi:Ca2+ activated outward rectifying K+ channel 3 [Striga asiatica]|uniref:Ca2+ activated outward rectifying K+ channel 3 n=1 Tax=Striga asiatica TaxID=4170 RepID=A0A5A7QPI8_STRAF|nr:Ca2+ activated outward rectifying K+ channel 3 [Striga asiatica]